MKHIFCLSIVLLFFVAGTGISHAYFTTDQHAFSVGDHGFYLIDFAFGHEDHEVYIPVATTLSDSTLDKVLSYQIYNSDGETASGTAVGLVLGNAPYRDGMYVVPKGEKASFTLFVVFSPEETESGQEFRTKVTHLPFSFDGTERLKLNPSELQYYVTPEIEFDSMPNVTVKSVEVLFSSSNDSPQQSLSSNKAEVNTRQTDD